MAANTPTGTTPPTRPGTEQLDLFDAEQLIASVEQRLGRWGDTYSVALTLMVDGTLNRLLPHQHGRRKVARATLIAMGGRGWTDVPSEIVGYVAGVSPGRARHHQRDLVADGILERDPIRPRTWRPGPVTRLAMPQIISRSPGGREIPTVSRSPGGRGTQRPERDHHHGGGDEANRAEPQRLPWLTDTACPTCETGRLARKPDGELDAVCKACRRRQLDNAQRPAPAPPRPTHCACGALLPLTATGEPMPSCHECATEGRGDADRRQ